MRHILLIDDDPAVLRIFTLGLERAGYRVSTAPSGKAGLETLTQEKIDLLITDIFMPEMDGLEVIMRCRRLYDDLKIYAISGGGQMGGNVDGLPVAKNLGADRIFIKPVSLPKLVAAIDAELGVA